MSCFYIYVWTDTLLVLHIIKRAERNILETAWFSLQQLSLLKGSWIWVSALISDPGRGFTRGRIRRWPCEKRFIPTCLGVTLYTPLQYACKINEGRKAGRRKEDRGSDLSVKDTGRDQTSVNTPGIRLVNRKGYLGYGRER